MPWLVVFGAGSWSPERGVRFEAGVHEIDERMVELVKESKLDRLLVTATKPEVLVDDGVGPLTPEDVALGTQAGVVLKPRPPEPGEPDTIPADPVEEHELLGSEGAFKCQWCTEGFPSDAARGRHIWIHHSSKAPEVSSTE